MAKMFKKLPGVLSFQRCLLVTDALFLNVFEGGSTTPLPVIRHGIRGTQNINKFGKKEDSSAKSATRPEVSNIQTTDSAKLDPQAVRLRVWFETLLSGYGRGALCLRAEQGRQSGRPAGLSRRAAGFYRAWQGLRRSGGTGPALCAQSGQRPFFVAQPAVAAQVTCACGSKTGLESAF